MENNSRLHRRIICIGRKEWIPGEISEGTHRGMELEEFKKKHAGWFQKWIHRKYFKLLEESQKSFTKCCKRCSRIVQDYRDEGFRGVSRGVSLASHSGFLRHYIPEGFGWVPRGLRCVRCQGLPKAVQGHSRMFQAVSGAFFEVSGRFKDVPGGLLGRYIGLVFLAVSGGFNRVSGHFKQVSGAFLGVLGGFQRVPEDFKGVS